MIVILSWRVKYEQTEPEGQRQELDQLMLLKAHETTLEKKLVFRQRF
jgi:hypothetical protein